MKRKKIEIELNINNKNFKQNLIKNENFSSSSESENYIEKINEKIYLTQIKNENLLNEENIKKKDIFNYDKNYDEIQKNKKLKMNEKKNQLKKSNLVNKILKTVEIKNLNILKNKQKIENEKYFKKFGKKIPIFYTKNYKNKINELNNNNNNFFDDFSKNKEIINNRKEEYSKNLYSNFEIENFNNLLKKNNKITENNNNNNNLSNEEKINFYKKNYLQRKKIRNESNL